jgi:hypothetical protein
LLFCCVCFVLLVWSVIYFISVFIVFIVSFLWKWHFVSLVIYVLLCNKAYLFASCWWVNQQFEAVTHYICCYIFFHIFLFYFHFWTLCHTLKCDILRCLCCHCFYSLLSCFFCNFFHGFVYLVVPFVCVVVCLYQRVLFLFSLSVRVFWFCNQCLANARLCEVMDASTLPHVAMGA